MPPTRAIVGEHSGQTGTASTSGRRESKHQRLYSKQAETAASKPEAKHILTIWLIPAESSLEQTQYFRGQVWCKECLEYVDHHPSAIGPSCFCGEVMSGRTARHDVGCIGTRPLLKYL